jgi:uncharacterized protein (DUF427 family)
MLTYPIEGGHKITFEPVNKWLRVMFVGQIIADSKRAYLLLPGGPPFYYFPKADVRMDLFQPSDYSEESPLLGKAVYWNIKFGDKLLQNAAWTHPEPASSILDLTGYVAFDWAKMDAWFEEAEQVYIHPHDPYKRIDILQSTRQVVVIVGSEKVAESNRPTLLFETGLPTRYYLPKLDVRMDLLVPSDKVTGCAYKGLANYYSVKIGDKTIPDIAWYYRYPTPEASKISGLICFFNEKVDMLYVDGEEQPKPRTPWS